MNKKSIRDVDLGGKRALVRVDFNVPLDDKQAITDDTRIRAAVPTIQYLLEQGASVVLMSHLGRPKKGPSDDLRLDPVARRLEELLGSPVRKIGVTTGSEAVEAATLLKPGEVLLLENTRFDPREEKNDPEMAAELAKLGDISMSTMHSARLTAPTRRPRVSHACCRRSPGSCSKRSSQRLAARSSSPSVHL